MTTIDTDVIIAGMGPTGLVLANLLGARGVRTLIVDKRDRLIDYPRGVGLDDESYRTIQAMDLVEAVKPYTLPHHIMRIVNGEGEVIMTNDPQGRPFGHDRKYGFIQPLVDKTMYEGLARYKGTVTPMFSRELIEATDHGGDNGVTVTLRHVAGEDGDTYEEGPDGAPVHTTVNARFLVGCEGGRSFTRKWMGVDFEGVSPATRWVVIDVRNDPLGFPNVYLGADPARPYVSIGLPHGIRRFEFLLFDDEPNEIVEDDAFVTRLLNEHLPAGAGVLDIIRHRVFTHHGRVASEFRKGNVMIAGDAAHLMPVWMGQGFNSGVRDATNLAWKLAAVVRGTCGAGLLDTYAAERKEHAKAMVDLSLTLGNIIKPTNKGIAFARDLTARVANVSPAVRSYFTDMKFKPMPRYTAGVVVDQRSLTPGKAAAKIPTGKAAGIIPLRVALAKNSPVGVQFIQPQVTHSGEVVLFDEVLGTEFALVTWGLDPARVLGDTARRQVDEQGWARCCVVSANQEAWAKEHCDPGTRVVVDHTGALKAWFDKHAVGTVIVRPDRFVAAACLNAQVPAAVQAVRTAASFR